MCRQIHKEKKALQYAQENFEHLTLLEHSSKIPGWGGKTFNPGEPEATLVSSNFDWGEMWLAIYRSGDNAENSFKEGKIRVWESILQALIVI